MARGWTSFDGHPPYVGPFLRDHGFKGCDSDPIAVRARRDPQGRIRRIHARYEGGWSCIMSVSADGFYSLTQCLRLRIGGKVQS